MRKQIICAGMAPMGTMLLSISILVLGTTLYVETASGQELSSNLQIATPANGAVYAPGDTIPIVVSSVPGSSPSAVGVIGEDMGFSSAKNTAPFTFSLSVPNTLCGLKKLTAYEFTSPGVGVFSAPVTVDIESSASLLTLNVNLTVLDLKYRGAQFPVNVVGTFADGMTRDVTESSRVEYFSNNSAVASVSSAGLVTANRNGRADTVIVVSYEGNSTSIPVSIPAPIGFATFSAEFTGSSQTGILKGTFSLGIGSDGISPVVEPVSIQIDAQQVFIPANSFTEHERGRFRVDGTFDGARVRGWIVPIQSGQFEFRFELWGLYPRSISKAATIVVLVGDDGGVANSVLRR